MHVGAREGHKRAPYPLVLELEAIVSRCESDLWDQQAQLMLLYAEFSPAQRHFINRLLVRFGVRGRSIVVK